MKITMKKTLLIMLLSVPASVGWGLGLSIVKCIVESHGGTIGVESPENVGAKFNVRLPIDCRQNHDSAVS